MYEGHQRIARGVMPRCTLRACTAQTVRCCAVRERRATPIACNVAMDQGRTKENSHRKGEICGRHGQPVDGAESPHPLTGTRRIAELREPSHVGPSASGRQLFFESVCSAIVADLAEGTLQRAGM